MIDRHRGVLHSDFRHLVGTVQTPSVENDDPPSGLSSEIGIVLPLELAISEGGLFFSHNSRRLGVWFQIVVLSGLGSFNRRFDTTAWNTYFNTLASAFSFTAGQWDKLLLSGFPVYRSWGTPLVPGLPNRAISHNLAYQTAHDSDTPMAFAGGNVPVVYHDPGFLYYQTGRRPWLLLFLGPVLSASRQYEYTLSLPERAGWWTTNNASNQFTFSFRTS